jgi:hypothetical protein
VEPAGGYGALFAGFVVTSGLKVNHSGNKNMNKSPLLQFAVKWSTNNVERSCMRQAMRGDDSISSVWVNLKPHFQEAIIYSMIKHAKILSVDLLMGSHRCRNFATPVSSQLGHAGIKIATKEDRFVVHCLYTSGHYSPPQCLLSHPVTCSMPYWCLLFIIAVSSLNIFRPNVLPLPL